MGSCFLGKVPCQGKDRVFLQYLLEGGRLEAAVAVDFTTFDIAILHGNYLFFKRC